MLYFSKEVCDIKSWSFIGSHTGLGPLCQQAMSLNI